MSDLIERKEVKRILDAVCMNIQFAGYLKQQTDEEVDLVLRWLDVARTLVDCLPTVEPKKGEWTDDNACPFCGFQPWYERDIHTLSFCPNCGAKMEE